MQISNNPSINPKRKEEWRKYLKKKKMMMMK
jgi:hypothetical protein